MACATRGIGRSRVLSPVEGSAAVCGACRRESVYSGGWAGCGERWVGEMRRILVVSELWKRVLQTLHQTPGSRSSSDSQGVARSEHSTTVLQNNEDQ